MKAKVVAGVVIAIIGIGLIAFTVSRSQAQTNVDSDDLAGFVALIQYIRSTPTPSDVKANNLPILTILDTNLSNIYITGFITPFTGETPEQVKARLESVPEQDRFTAVMVESYRLASDPLLLDIIHQLLPLYYVDFFTTTDLGGASDFLKKAEIESLASAFDSTNYTIPAPSTTGALQPTPTSIITQPTPTPQPSLALRYDPAGQDRDCDDFATWREAQAFFLATQNDSHGLDSDGNGIACEDLPGAPEPTVIEVFVTPTPTPSPTPVPPEDQGLSRHSPFPMDYGCVGATGDFCIDVVSLDWDAWPEIQAENESNDSPPADHKFVMIEMSAHLGVGHGETETSSGSVLSRAAVLGQGTNVAIDSGGCGIIPNAFPSTDVSPGDSVSGNICYVVPEEDISTLVLRWDSSWIPLWYALR